MAVRRGNNTDDQLRGTEERDTLIGAGENDSLFGLDEADVINGGNGNDTLSGGKERDTLDGGNGNDVYIVDDDQGGDRIVEQVNNGIDTVRATVTLGLELDSNIENLIMRGKQFFYGKGNALDNNIRGTNYKNALAGANGNDRLNGRGNNDVLQGELGNDSLIGGNGNDSLIGGAGDDVLTGGAGRDEFIYTTRRALVGQDTLVDFTKGVDRLTLSRRTFGLTSIAGNSFSLPTEFASVEDQAAAEVSTALVVFNRANSTLIYNQNGAAAGLGTGGTFATIANAATIDATDFTILG